MTNQNNIMCSTSGLLPWLSPRVQDQYPLQPSSILRHYANRLLSTCICDLYDIFDPILFLFCNVKLYVKEPNFVPRYLQKYVLHLFQFLENDYLDDKLWFCLKIQNPNFSLHGYFNKLKVISVETLMITLKYLSNYLQENARGLSLST